MPQTTAVKAKEYLSRDALSHIDMLEAIDRGSADILYAEHGGVILIERESRSCMISVDEISICEELPSLGSYPQYAAHQRDAAAYITQGRSFPHSLTVCQAAGTRTVRNENELIALDFAQQFEQAAMNVEGIGDQFATDALV